MLNPIDLPRTDLNLLVVFQAVFAERHVGRAAQRLSLTPSAVSHGLGRLRRLLHDPLFVRTPRGVVPTAKANELAAPITEILGRVRGVLSTAEPFRPETARRRFTIGAPDSVSATFLPPLLDELERTAPGVDVGVRPVLPAPDVTTDQPWRQAFVDLESGALDVAVLPVDDVPARFAKQPLHDEDFVIAMRRGHALARRMTLEAYCDAKHLVVSLTGDGHGFVDDAMAARGRSRRVALAVPNFMVALALLSETDLVSALPRRFVAAHGRRFEVVGRDAPLPLPRFRLSAVAPRAALMDRGVAWLVQALVQTETHRTRRG